MKAAMDAGEPPYGAYSLQRIGYFQTQARQLTS